MEGDNEIDNDILRGKSVRFFVNNGFFIKELNEDGRIVMDRRKDLLTITTDFTAEYKGKSFKIFENGNISPLLKQAVEEAAKVAEKQEAPAVDISPIKVQKKAPVIYDAVPAQKQQNVVVAVSPLDALAPEKQKQKQMEKIA